MRWAENQHLNFQLWLYHVSIRLFKSLMMPAVWSIALQRQYWQITCMHKTIPASEKKKPSSNCRQRVERYGRQLCWPSRKSMVTTSQVKQLQHPCLTCKRWASTCSNHPSCESALVCINATGLAQNIDRSLLPLGVEIHFLPHKPYQLHRQDGRRHAELSRKVLRDIRSSFSHNEP